MRLLGTSAPGLFLAPCICFHVSVVVRGGGIFCLLAFYVLVRLNSPQGPRFFVYLMIVLSHVVVAVRMKMVAWRRGAPRIR